MKARQAMAGLMVWAATGSARADELSATLGEPLHEASHEVRVEIDGGVARYTVRRTIRNDGDRPDEAELWIDPPTGAAADGLRIRGKLHGKPHWFRGDLMDAERAASIYRQLTGLGTARLKDPALLQWFRPDLLGLQVFPVPARGSATFEYSFTAPLQYRDGRYLAPYPIPGTGGASLPVSFPRVSAARGPGGEAPVLIAGPQSASLSAPVVLGPILGLGWTGDAPPIAAAGYAASRLPVVAATAARRVRVDFAVRHQRRGDLVVTLVAPGGESVEVARGFGSETDMRGPVEVLFDRPVRTAGIWHLLVADRMHTDTGALESWSVTVVRDGPTEVWRSVDVPQPIPDAQAQPDDATMGFVAFEPPPIHTLAARLGRVVASKRHQISRIEIDAAPQLSTVPKGASVVFVVDASFSVGSAGVGDQLALAQAYARWVPDAVVEMVVFDRKARRVFGRFVPATDLASAIADARRKGSFRRRNGSALDEGLTLARNLLRPRSGPLRIVGLTDGLMRTRFPTHSAARVAGSGAAIGHVALIQPRETADRIVVARDDAHPLAVVAANSGGVVFRVSGVRAPGDLAEHVEGLVRPTSIDGLRVSGVADMWLPESLGEGQGIREMEVLRRAPGRVTIEGKLWQQPVRRVVRADARFSRATAAFVFSHDHHDALSEAEMRRVARMGRVVSPVTSYLAIEPGVRPSTAGIDRTVPRIRVAKAMVKGAWAPGSPTVRRRALAELVKTGARRCAKRAGLAAGWRVELVIETTHDEVVDVEPKAATSSVASGCAKEAAWDVVLGPGYLDPRESHTVEITG